MDELEAVDRLVRRAKDEPAPAANATGAVLRRIRAGRPAGVLPLSLVAAAASLAAAVILTLAIHTYSAGADPQAALYAYSVVEATQP
jgi:hypothetical protein